MNNTIASIVAILLIVSFCVGVVAGVGSEEKVQRKQAIDAGVAYYSVDSKTGRSFFNYKSPCQ